jgi:Protein of unknown function (DUF2511)
MKRLVLPLIFVTALVPATAEAARRVTASEFGDRWPFTVAEGEIDCIRGPEESGRRLDAIVFRSGGKTYGLNGAAERRGDLRINPIWRADPAKPERRVNLAPLLYLGARECDAPPGGR